jgi:hypothetical protein
MANEEDRRPMCCDFLRRDRMLIGLALAQVFAVALPYAMDWKFLSTGHG